MTKIVIDSPGNDYFGYQTCLPELGLTRKQAGVPSDI